MDCKVKLGYEDISIVPEVISDIKSRKECFCWIDGWNLPIFTAPMDNVVDESTSKVFRDRGIPVVFPRTIPFERRINLLYQSNNTFFISFSQQEAKELFLNYTSENSILLLRLKIKESINRGWFICIDIADGHMSELLQIVKQIKENYNAVKIMTGNIANPKTYEHYENAGCDYVRCNIGSGSGCTTASNVGVFYPTFSLIKETWEEKQRINGKCKIIADGGIKGYRDIQKALIYADYVMIGGLFSKAIDSAGTPVYGRAYWNFFGKRILNPFKTFFIYGKPVKPKNYEKVLKQIKRGKLDVWKQFYGMSTKVAQAKMNPDAKLKTSEGLVKLQKVEYSLAQWVQNETDYLRSAMSYTNSRNLEEYKNSKWVRKAYRAYND